MMDASSLEAECKSMSRGGAKGWSIQFENMSKEVVSATGVSFYALRGASGTVRCGETMALMGKSGSGKTTLLNALGGRNLSNVTGRVYLGGKLFKREMQRHIGYVQQEDMFMPSSTFTVRDQLMFSATVRAPPSVSQAQIVADVDALIKLLNLSSCASTPLLLASGGEKKRTSLGTELLTSPRMLLVDEATSGLDSSAAISLIKLIKSVAVDKRMPVVISIHQPSTRVFYSFDKLLLLADGQVVYRGPPQRVLEHFSVNGFRIPADMNYNPADFVIDVLSNGAAGNGFIFSTSGGDYHKNGDINGRKEEKGSPPHTLLINVWREGYDDLAYYENNGATAQDEKQASDHDGESMGEAEGEDGEYFRASAHLSSWRQLARAASRAMSSSMSALHISEKHSSSNLSKGGATSPVTTPQVLREGGVHEPASTFSRSVMAGCIVGVAVAAELLQIRAIKEPKFYSSFPRQFWALYMRSLKSFQSSQFSAVNVIQTIAVALLSGVCWFQTPFDETRVGDLSGFIFFLIAYWLFQGLFDGMLAFIPERPLLKKERASGSYRLSAYFIAKACASLPARIILPFIFVVIAYPIAIQDPAPIPFFGLWGILMLVTMLGESLGLVVGSVTVDLKVAVSLGTFVALATLILGGFYIKVLPPWLLWTHYATVLRYAFDACLTVLFPPSSRVRCDQGGYPIPSCNGKEYISGTHIVSWIGVLNDSLGYNVGIMLAWFFFFRFIAYCSLRFLPDRTPGRA